MLEYLTYSVVGKRSSQAAHADAMRKRSSVEVLPAKVFCKLQSTNGVCRLLRKVQVSLFVHVTEQITLVVTVSSAVYLHPLEQTYQRSTQALTNERPADDPSKEIANEEMMLEHF